MARSVRWSTRARLVTRSATRQGAEGPGIYGRVVNDLRQAGPAGSRNAGAGVQSYANLRTADIFQVFGVRWFADRSAERSILDVKGSLSVGQIEVGDLGPRFFDRTGRVVGCLDLLGMAFFGGAEPAASGRFARGPVIGIVRWSSSRRRSEGRAGI